MNSNTVVMFQGGTGVGQIASQTLASTTETEFVYNTGATPATAIAVIAPPLTTSIVGARSQFDPASNLASTVRTGNRFGNQYFNVNHLDLGAPFLVRVCGVATPASNGANSLNVILYLGATKAGTALCSTGVVPQATTTVVKSFVLEAQLIWSSVAQTLHGQYWFKLEGTGATDYLTWTELSANGASVTASALQFCASATWGNAVGGVCAVSEFSLSRL